MKNIFSLIALLAVFALASCGGVQKTEQKAATEEVKKEETKEYASAYICPMHCEGSGDEAMGKCPKCDMDYVANENHPSHQNKMKDSTATEEHGHDHDHGDHQH